MPVEFPSVVEAVKMRCRVNLWKWINAYGEEFGIERPYLDKDPPHVAPIDGKEYAAHRRGTKAQHAGLAMKKRKPATCALKHMDSRQVLSKIIVGF